MPGFAAHAFGFNFVALVAMALAASRCRAPEVDSAPPLLAPLLRSPNAVDADDGRELIRASVTIPERCGGVIG